LDSTVAMVAPETILLEEGEITRRLLKTHSSCHPEVAPVLRDRRICFIFSTRKQQILRSSTPATAKVAVAGDPGCAQDDTSENSFSAAG